MNEEKNERVLDQLFLNLVMTEDMKTWQNAYATYAKYFCLCYNAAKSQKISDEIAADLSINMILTQWEHLLDSIKT